MITRLPVRHCSDKARDECDRKLCERRDGRRRKFVKPGQCWALQCDRESSTSYGVLISVQFHMIFVCIEVVYGVFCSVERLDLRHSELCRKREVQHPGCEWGFGLLYQGVHGDWNSALCCFLHVADFFLDVPKPLLPRLLLCLLLLCILLIKDGPIAFVVPALPLLIAVLSEGLVRIMLTGVTSFSFSICLSTRVEVLLFSGNKILAFSGLSCLLVALYLLGELLKFF